MKKIICFHSNSPFFSMAGSVSVKQKSGKIEECMSGKEQQLQDDSYHVYGTVHRLATTQRDKQFTSNNGV